MATLRHPQHHHVSYAEKDASQKVCLIMGFALIVIGLLGTVMPETLGLHLSAAHNLIHLVTGILSMWAGSADDPKKALVLCITAGFIYATLGVAGFIIGTPGYPSPNMPGMRGDQYLFRVIPNTLELGSMDHTVHLIVAAFFLFAAVPANKNEKNVTTQNQTTEDKSQDKKS